MITEQQAREKAAKILKCSEEEIKRGGKSESAFIFDGPQGDGVIIDKKTGKAGYCPCP